MGRGSSDPILNRQMPRRASVLIPDCVRICEDQPCRDADELRQCKQVLQSLGCLFQEIEKDKVDLLAAKKIIEAKIKAYENDECDLEGI